MINPYPHELSIGDVYFSPLLAVLFMAFISALLTVIILNKLKLSRFLAAPPYVFMAILIFYVLLIDTFWIKI